MLKNGEGAREKWGVPCFLKRRRGRGGDDLMDEWLERSDRSEGVRKRNFKVNTRFHGKRAATSAFGTRTSVNTKVDPGEDHYDRR